MVLNLPIFDQYVCPSTSTPFGISVSLSFLNLVAQVLIQVKAKKEFCYSKNYGPSLQNGDSFDFIIIGSGAGGSTVAYRLTENLNVTVLLVEVGGYPSTTTDIPNLFIIHQRTPEDWQYTTEPSNSSCMGMTNQRCRWPRGKVLGGCSTINAMIHLRGYERDFQQWVDAGNYGWDYDTMLDYYRKSETVLDPVVPPSGLYGTSGPLRAEIHDNGEPIKNIMKAAAAELGIGSSDIQPTSGYFNCLSAIINGTRFTSAKAYIAPMRDRPNLFLSVDTWATKIVIDPVTKIATGVQLSIGLLKRNITVKATKEVILSAGVINSAQLLMLSGVGPQEHLEEKGIPVIKNLPVGKNLHDHPVFPGLSVNVSDDDIIPKNAAVDAAVYLTNRTGTFSYPNLLHFMSFMNVWNDSQYPDIQFHHMIFNKYDTASFGLTLYVFDQDSATNAQELAYVNQYNILKLAPTLVDMKSRGELLLKNTNPFDQPLIYSGYFTDPEDRDLNTFMKAIQYVKDLVNTTTFASHNIELLKPLIPNCEDISYETQNEEYWKCALRNTATTVFHPAGTCKMGPVDDPTAVVDPELKVHGIGKLRVVDGSIMPREVSCNPYPTTVAIGEKGADMIKLAHGI